MLVGVLERVGDSVPVTEVEAEVEPLPLGDPLADTLAVELGEAVELPLTVTDLLTVAERELVVVTEPVRETVLVAE